MFDDITDAISKISPTLGAGLAGPAGAIIGALIGNALKVDTLDSKKIADKLKEPESIDKLKELELKLADLQDAREEASKETGINKLTRPFLALLSMLALLIDLIAMNFSTSNLVQQVLLIMLIFIIWDIRQIYKFYFGSGENIPFIKK